MMGIRGGQHLEGVRRRSLVYQHRPGLLHYIMKVTITGGSETRHSSFNSLNVRHAVSRACGSMPPMSDNDLVACLKACEQSLKSVTIHGALSYSSCSVLVQMLTPSQESILDDEGAFEDDTPCFFPRLTELSIDTRIPNACSLVDMVQRRMGLGPPQPTTYSSPSPPLPRLHVLPFKCLRLQYPAGHKDISTLRDIAAAANSLRRDALDLRIVESRMGNLRGSSAGRSVRPYMFRRKVCASR